MNNYNITKSNFSKNTTNIIKKTRENLEEKPAEYADLVVENSLTISSVNEVQQSDNVLTQHSTSKIKRLRLKRDPKKEVFLLNCNNCSYEKTNKFFATYHQLGNFVSVHCIFYNIKFGQDLSTFEFEPPIPSIFYDTFEVSGNVSGNNRCNYNLYGTVAAVNKTSRVKCSQILSAMSSKTLDCICIFNYIVNKKYSL